MTDEQEDWPKNDSRGSSQASGEVSTTEHQKIPGIPKRYILVLLCFFGLFQMYAIRTCLSVAIVAMATNRTVIENGVEVNKGPEFDWTSEVQGIILGSFYYGYAVFQIPAGMLALRYGGKPVFGFAILIASILTVVTPPIVRYNFKLFIVLRIFEGLALGLIAAAHHCIWATWSPMFERSSLLTIAGSGTIVGTIVTMPITGVLSESEGGWPFAFYFIGSFGILWFVVWQICMYETPKDHPCISKEEIDYIGNPWDMDPEKVVKINIPWKDIGLSLPVWACTLTFLVSDWCFYTMLICIPLYMKQVLKCSVAETGFISAIPYILMAIISPSASLLADQLITRKVYSIEFTRKLFQAVGLLISSCFVVAVGYETRAFSSLVLLTLGIGTYGIGSPGASPNLIDLSPKYAGLLMGIANTAGSLSGFLSPAVVGILTTHGTLEEWRLVFWLTALMALTGTLVYTAFGSAHKQPWAED
ncbi:vesicular glutamate transporter 1-like [Actinia tenebrosa]|uniref:Vesicular glutamate transporter 1-like n=1 Tax=Actinia tenebrosa TaxID=6105 RepID=A0A6P8IT40_ACTTE|nr:vesicular glutamate transporter 1-like [Actinia tenebrosa]